MSLAHLFTLSFACRLTELIYGEEGPAYLCGILNFELYALKFPKGVVTKTELQSIIQGEKACVGKIYRDGKEVEAEVKAFSALWQKQIDSRTNKPFSGVQLHEALVAILEQLWDVKEEERVTKKKGI